MDYKKVYDKFVVYFKNTSPKDRLLKRNKNDLRLYNEYIYTETHHILPKSLGGTDNIENLVDVLPEEHIFIHELRYKVFGKREDMLAVRFCLNGFKGKSYFKQKQFIILNKKLRSGFAWMKQHSASFRKKVGWQTEDGRKRISEATKNKIIVKDANTSELIGKVSCDHPKVLSREWIHHSTGFVSVINKDTNKKQRITVDEYRKNKHKYTPNTGKRDGENNGKYSGITRKDVIDYFKQYLQFVETLDDKCLMSKSHFYRFVEDRFNKKLPAINSLFKEFRFPEYKENKHNNLYFLVDIIIKDETEKYKFFNYIKTKSKEHRKKLKFANLKKNKNFKA